MRQLGYTSEWQDETVGTLAASARLSEHSTALSTMLNDHILHADRKAMDVGSFWRSMTFWVRQLGKKNTPVVRDVRELVDILYGEKLPTQEQLYAIGQVLNLTSEKFQQLRDALLEQIRAQNMSSPISLLADRLEQQSEIVAFGPALRERLRRMAGASSERIMMG